jgi:hypothetical protein
MLESNEYLITLQRERDKLVADRERIDGQIAGIEFALRHYGASDQSVRSTSEHRSSPAQNKPPREGSIKDYAFALVAEFPDGLSSGDLLKEAARRGRPLNRNTITSLLSASASRGALEFANGRYCIPKGLPEAIPASGSHSNQV